MTLSLGRWRNICLCPIEPPGFAHSAAVAEHVEALIAGFRRLGATVERWANETSENAVNLVILPNLLDQARADRLPHDAILYNFEQIGSANDNNPVFHAATRRHILWDYSLRNLERLKPICGHDRLIHVPVGYVPELTRITPDPIEDIDVLFYGVLSPRRRAAIQAMTQAGLVVRAVFGVYGARRDALISRAKVVVNIHHAADSELEVIRLSYLMANRKPILTEYGPQTHAEPDLLAGVLATPYDELADAAVALVRDPAARSALRERGFETFRRRDQVAILRKAIAATDALASVAAGCPAQEMPGGDAP
jgi:hypothetical protein